MNIPGSQNPVSSALRSLSQGQYYATRTGEVLGKAEAALDGFVGSVMNISHDNEDRNVSRLGGELAMKVRKGERYLSRGEVNQRACNKALTEASGWMREAVTSAQDEGRREQLVGLLGRLNELAANRDVERSVESVTGRLNGEGRERITKVEADVPGKDVSAQGRPLWNLFEASMVELDATRGVLREETQKLDTLASELRRLES